jgi:hypothetical protein
MSASKIASLRAVTLVECVLLLPATVFIAAAVLRLLQPRQYEPARASWAIFDWTVNHVPDLGAVTLFVGLPGLALLLGGIALLRFWRREEALRNDAAAAVAIMWRQRVIVFLGAATLLAAALLAFAFGHMITG